MASSTWSTFDGIGLSKKHDAPRAIQHTSPTRLSLSGFRRRRLILAICALIALYFFVKNIPTDVVPVGQRYSSTFGSLAPGHVQAQYGMHKSDAGRDGYSNAQQYGDSIQFQNLVRTLRPHVSWSENNNVLFAITELRSASNLIPIACQMARNNRNKVHVVLLGQQRAELQDIMYINGIPINECPVFWHDAIPDLSQELSSAQVEASIRAGFGHCCLVLRPQVVLVDHIANTNTVPGAILQEVAASVRSSIVTLSEDASQYLPWITSLDHKSLQKLAEVEIDIVIQAYSESAGSLIRLLRSIERANYKGLFYPRLTLELPVQIDPFLSEFLSRFRWPPGSTSLENRMTLRHRLSTGNAKVAEASLRMLESFYPCVAANSHVLLLNSDAELSSSYLHYLVLTVLEYKYGQDHGNLTDSLFGISLQLPDQKLDGTKPFVQRKNLRREPFVLSPSPNDKALLIFGDKWIEFQSFLTHRFSRDPELTQKTKVAATVNKEYSNWVSELLSLIHAQCYYILYPSFAAKRDETLVTVHREPGHSPEEYLLDDSNNKKPEVPDISGMMAKDVLTGSIDLPSIGEHLISNGPALPLQKLLLPNGKNSRSLPKLGDIPLVAYSGKTTDWSKSRIASERYAADFSLNQGGCVSSGARKEFKQGSIDHLFCDT